MSRASNSLHKQSDVWKVLHGAPPTPPAPRRDPDRNPVPIPTAGQQQRAAALAAQQAEHANMRTYADDGAKVTGLQHSYSAGSPELLHTQGTTHHRQLMAAESGQLLLRGSLDELMMQQQYRSSPSPDHQQFGHTKQAWGPTATAPTGKLLPYPAASSPQV